MGKKPARVIGTTPDCIATAEQTIGSPLPPSFHEWLLVHNGLNLDSVRIFPVFDARDPRKTWDSIARYHNAGAWLEDQYESLTDEVDASNLLPFAEPDGSGDVYCFDLTQRSVNGEYAVLWMSHETGDLEWRAASFADFVIKLEHEEIED